MKYGEKDFTINLKEKVINIEETLKDLIEKLIDENKPLFTMKGINVDGGFGRVGNDPFHPGYSSSIYIGICDGNSGLTDLHIISIWECDRYFLGMPVSVKIPGSKIAGELLEESFEDIKLELKEYIEEQLIFIND